VKALIDGDILVYRIGFASKDVNEKLAMSRMTEFLEELVMMPEINEYQGYLTGSNNYRNEIAKTAPYKGNRTGERPVHYDLLRQYLNTAWDFKIVENQEADDAIGIAAYEFESDEDYMIMSIDKDLDMLRGWHYNFSKNIKYHIDEFDGILNFYKQLLVGDRVDNIIGLKGIGPKKAEKILKDCVTELDMYNAVLEAYDNNIERLMENGQLLWIRRKENQLWQPPQQPTSTG
jgi:hypothetical protein